MSEFESPKKALAQNIMLSFPIWLMLLGGLIAIFTSEPVHNIAPGLISLILGFLIFLIVRLKKIKKGSLFSFGWEGMSSIQKKSYVFGYCLMILGILLILRELIILHGS